MMNLNESGILIAYYSRKGENYVSGSIVDLPVGNTESVASMIQEKVGGVLFEIETVESYPMGYTETTEVAQSEQRGNARPELAAHVKNMASYDVIFLGYPNWWGTMPMAVFTFLEEYDFSGKTIIPFCTHEGSGLGRSERDIAELCPTSEVIHGKAILGSHVQSAQNEVLDWLRGLEV